MLSLYLLTFGFGAVLVGSSVVLGAMGDDLDKDFDADGDFDVDHDVDLDADADVDGDVGHVGGVHVGGMDDHDVTALQETVQQTAADSALWFWLPFLSLRFWSFGAAAFGATGLGLTLASIGDVPTAIVASLMGYVTGLGSSWAFRQLKRDMVTGDTTLKRFVGEQATVVLTIRPGQVGSIRLTSSAGDVEVPATTRDKGELPRGSAVIVAGFTDRVADVTSMPALATDAPED